MQAGLPQAGHLCGVWNAEWGAYACGPAGEEGSGGVFCMQAIHLGGKVGRGLMYSWAGSLSHVS